MADAPSTSSSEEGSDPTARRFKTPGDATRELHAHYSDWTAGLGKYGLQIAFALIATNWALHGSQQAILRNPWAKASIVCAVGYLTVFLILMAVMVGQLRRRHRYADKNKEDWAVEFKANADEGSAWPYTDAIERTGDAMHLLHALAPLLSGLFLLIGIFVTPTDSPAPNSGKSADIGTCCTSVANDVAAIRGSVEGFVAGGGSWAGPAASALGDRVIAVPGESQLRLNGWVIAGIALCVVSIVAGAGLLFSTGSGTQKAIGASLLTIGTLTGGGFALVKDVKIESVFKVDVDKLLDHLRIEIGQLGGAGPERLGSVDKFKLGDDKLIEAPPKSFTPVEKVDAIRDIAAAWLKGRGGGRNAVLLVIGGADRLPIEGKKGQQYDANVGLAMARGEAVKRALLDSCLEQARQGPQKCDLSEEQIIVLVSGPRHTPEAGDTSSRASKEGFPEDRRVDVWALWTRKGTGFTIGR